MQAVAHTLEDMDLGIKQPVDFVVQRRVIGRTVRCDFCHLSGLSPSHVQRAVAEREALLLRPKGNTFYLCINGSKRAHLPFPRLSRLSKEFTLLDATHSFHVLQHVFLRRLVFDVTFLVASPWLSFVDLAIGAFRSYISVIFVYL